MEESHGTSAIVCLSCFDKFYKNIIIENIIELTGDRERLGIHSIYDINDRKEYIIKYLKDIKSTDSNIINNIIEYVKSYHVGDENEIYLTQEQLEFLKNQINTECYDVDDAFFIDILRDEIEKRLLNF